MSLQDVSLPRNPPELRGFYRRPLTVWNCGNAWLMTQSTANQSLRSFALIKDEKQPAEQGISYVLRQEQRHFQLRRPLVRLNLTWFQ